MFLGRSPASTDPEQKRKIIGSCSSTCSSEEAKKIGGARVPGAGHALPRRDRERVVHRRAVGHHQVAPQCRRPARAHEPQAGRAAARAVQGRGAALGLELGLPEDFVGRHPFPGPGLAVRMPGRDHRARSSTSCARPTRSSSRRSARAGLYDEIWQAFAVLLPVQTVGVMGDGRTYDYVVGAARRDLDRRHDRGLLSVRHEVLGARSRPASSTRSRASTASSTT